MRGHNLICRTQRLAKRFVARQPARHGVLRDCLWLQPAEDTEEGEEVEEGLEAAAVGEDY